MVPSVAQLALRPIERSRLGIKVSGEYQGLQGFFATPVALPGYSIDLGCINAVHDPYG